MKDKRIRYRRAEIDAVIQYQARCFVITKSDLTSGEMASRLLTVGQAIFDAATQRGPYIYAVQSDRIDRFTLGDPD